MTYYQMANSKSIFNSSATVTPFMIKLNGKIVKLTPFDVTPETSLNTYLRTNQNLFGTKFMCLEGGCGVCTVTIRRRHPVTKKKYTIAVNSCLYPILACDGVEVETIEYLKEQTKGYHPIQRRLAEYNGTQCGFCSPAMVMGMYSLMEGAQGRVTMEQVENSLGGHMCRCTGYRPILDAFKSLSVNAPHESRRNPTTNDIEDAPLCKKTGSSCAKTCTMDQIKKCFSPPIMLQGTSVWHKTVDLADVFAALGMVEEGQTYQLVCGNTAHGVYRRPDDIQLFIDVNNVPELRAHSVDVEDHMRLEVGGNVTLTEFMSILADCAKTHDKLFGYCSELVHHIDLIATTAVRNIGSIAGNLMIKKMHPEFPSDIFLLFATVDAHVVVSDGVEMKEMCMFDFMAGEMSMKKKVILKVFLPVIKSASNQVVTYKIMPRAQNSHAYVNAGFRFEFATADGGQVNNQQLANVTLCFGGITPQFVRATQTEEFLRGKNLFDATTLNGAYQILAEELQPDSSLLDASPEFRKQLALGLFYKGVLRVASNCGVEVDSRLRSGATLLQRTLSRGQQSFESEEKNYPLTQPVMKLEGYTQSAGEAVYSNDQPHTPQDVWCTWVIATEVNAKISNIDATEALKLDGVYGCFGLADVPGDNVLLTTDTQMTVQDEVLFVKDRVIFHGQPCGIIAAENFDLAQRAARLVKVTYEHSQQQKKRILPDVRSVIESLARNRIETRSENDDCTGTVETKKFQGKHEIRGEFNTSGQYHFTLEPQTTVCVPRDGKFDVYCATQWISSIHSAVTRVLAIPSHKVNVTVSRLGGGYGCKISGPIQVAASCALVSYHLKRPARFVMQLEQNMGSVGKRWPMMANYHTGFNEHGTIESMELEFFCDAGSNHNNFVEPLVGKSVGNCYNSQHWKLKPNTVLTDAPSNLWARAPGDVEGIAFSETIMEHMAFVLHLDPVDVRLANMDAGQPMHGMYKEFVKAVEYATRKVEVERFNANNRLKKRGIATMPMRYNFFYFGTMSIFLSIYHEDGSISITHGGIEMGQGLNTKACQVAAHFLHAPLECVNVKPSTEQVSPNSTMTGGSQTSEAIGYALMKACEEMNHRLEPIRTELGKDATWKDVVKAAYKKGTVDLSVTHLWRAADFTPYPIWGLCCAEIELDVLTGNVLVSRVDIEEDVGVSMSPLMDVGQVEGAFIMGLGYWMNEKLVYNRETGELLSNRTWTYKPPGAKDIPIDFRVKFLRNSPNPLGILRSKATGEPGVVLAYSVVLALRHALVSARKDAGLPEEWFEMEYPCLPENVLPLTGMLKNPIL